MQAIKTAIESGHGNAVVIAGAIGLVLSDVIPTPADAIYFHLMQKNKKRLENKQITPKQYWTREAVLYYGLNPLWWSLVLGTMLLMKGDYTQKLKVGVAIIGAGAVAGVINKNIRKDEQGV